jgi:hypothetical protein
MDAERFDAILRTFSDTLSRRAVSGFTLTGLLTALGSAIDADAKKKKKRKKKKKKCKSGTKKCGKKCISADDCCTSADCAIGGACAGGLCICPDGQHACSGECVDEERCCLQCGENVNDCCQGGEVCNGSFGSEICQDGGCPETDYCNSDEIFYCATEPQDCVCATTVDDPPANACVVLEALQPESCEPCSASSQCGDNEVCVPGDTTVSGFCADCTSSFCVPLCGEL